MYEYSSVCIFNYYRMGIQRRKSIGTYKYNFLYRIFFALIAYAGATTTLEIAWTFSDIANALMAIPNLICLLSLNNVIVKEINLFESEFRK